MKRIIIEGQVCIGPNYSKGEIAFIKLNLSNLKGLGTLADLFDAAGNVQRLKILYLLHAHKEMCVCDLSEVLEISDSAVSQHLRKMKDKHLVQSRREGQTIFYSIQENLFTSKLGTIFELDEIKERHAFNVQD